MRFFAHDGRAFHGPSAPDELLKLPGFDGDTLVCPAGSENSADWKPAISYAPFREALLAPLLKFAPPPEPAPAPAPLPAPAATRNCPACAHPNPEGARFCNECAARMDGVVDLPPPAAEPAPAFVPEPEPVPLFVHEPVPEPAAVLETLEPAPEPASIVLDEAPAAPEPEVPAAAPPARSRRKLMIASFLAALIAGGVLARQLLRPAKETPPPEPVAAPVAALPVAVSTAAVAAAPIEPAAPPPVPAPKPIPAPVPVAAAPAAPKKRRAPGRPRRKKPVAAPDRPATAPETAAPTAAAAPAAAPASEKGFMLPGVPRPVPPHSVVKEKTDAAAKPDAAPAAPDAASPPAQTDGAEDSAAHQVREQFEFCAQLLSQGAFADHYDTCLCAEARQALPYRGRRDYYAAAQKKSEAAGTLESVATVKDVAIDGNTAKVSALWRTAASLTPGTVRAETWQLEDGLWCRNP